MDIDVKVENVEADSEIMDAQLAHSDEQIDIEESDVKQERLAREKEWLAEDSVLDNAKNEDSAPPPDGLLKECRVLVERTLRASNFTPSESEKLMELVKTHKAVLLNKATDVANTGDKDACWQLIADTYNNSTQTSAYRDAKQLRIRFDNLRRAARKEITQWIKATRGTGGGPPPKELTETASWFYKEMPLSMAGHSELNLDDDAGDEKPIEDSYEILSPQQCRSPSPSKVTSSRIPQLMHRLAKYPITSPPSSPSYFESNKPSASSHMPSFSDSLSFSNIPSCSPHSVLPKRSAIPKHSSQTPLPSTSDSREIPTRSPSPSYLPQPTRGPVKRPAPAALKPSTELRRDDSSTPAFLCQPISQELHHQKKNPTRCLASRARRMPVQENENSSHVKLLELYKIQKDIFTIELELKRLQLKKWKQENPEYCDDN